MNLDASCKLVTTAGSVRTDRYSKSEPKPALQEKHFKGSKGW
jgi:hypothetical protein